MSGETQVKTCTTGSAGGCTMTEVPAGTYTITATAEGYTNYSASCVVSADATVNIAMTAAENDDD